MNSRYSPFVTGRDRERERGNQRAMARAFVVVGKSGAFMADHDGRFIEIDEMLRRDLAVVAVRSRVAERRDKADFARRRV